MEIGALHLLEVVQDIRFKGMCEELIGEVEGAEV
jgi:hypothetical protein